MKVRWTPESVRLRITPAELEALCAGGDVRTEVRFPGGRWAVVLGPRPGGLGLRAEGDAVLATLGPDDVRALCEPDREGVYGSADGGPRLLVEKDFPCAHPHAPEAAEEETGRFAPPAAFLARRLEAAH